MLMSWSCVCNGLIGGQFSFVTIILMGSSFVVCCPVSTPNKVYGMRNGP